MPLQLMSVQPMMNAQIAQLVEQRTENPRVTGSIPVLGIFLYDLHIGRDGRVAQVVEHLTLIKLSKSESPARHDKQEL